MPRPKLVLVLCENVSKETCKFEVCPDLILLLLIVPRPFEFHRDWVLSKSSGKIGANDHCLPEYPDHTILTCATISNSLTVRIYNLLELKIL